MKYIGDFNFSGVFSVKQKSGQYLKINIKTNQE